MKAVLVSICVLLITGILLVILFTFGIFARGCNTASKMADQTIFNADKNVWTYDTFLLNYQRWNQYNTQYKNAQAELDRLVNSNILAGQEYDSLVMQKNGASQMKANIASEYNKMASSLYQKIWKSKGLPQQLAFD